MPACERKDEGFQPTVTRQTSHQPQRADGETKNLINTDALMEQHAETFFLLFLMLLLESGPKTRRH